MANHNQKGELQKIIGLPLSEKLGRKRIKQNILRMFIKIKFFEIGVVIIFLTYPQPHVFYCGCVHFLKCYYYI